MKFSKGMVIFGRYKIIGPLGEGGYGAVYLAEDFLYQGKMVAVKVTNNDTLDQLQKNRTLDQFLLEASILANLSHPHLPKVENFGDLDEFLFLAMDFIPGDNLQVKLDKQGAMAESEVLPIIDQILDALVYIHGQTHAVIHRDIKPANIVVRKDGVAYLVDFGIAKIDRTLTGAKAYTPHFAPPEQHGAGTDPRSDIYSLGATLYALLTGQAPTESIERIQGTILPSPRQIKPSISSATEKIILKAMAIKPDDRFQSAQEMRLALGSTIRVIGEKAAPGISIKPPTPVKPAPSPVPASAPKPQPKAVAGKDIIVAADGSGQYETINEAVKVALPHQTIFVRSGTYRESLTITKSIAIVSDADPKKVVLIALKDQPAITLIQGKLSLKNLTITAQDTQKHSLILVAGGECRIEKCDLSGSECVVYIIRGQLFISNSIIHNGTLYGIAYRNQSVGEIAGCGISSNGETGIITGDEAKLDIILCEVHENKRHGIVVMDKSKPRITQTKSYQNQGVGFFIADQSTPVIHRCSTERNGQAIEIQKSASPNIIDCIFD